MIYGCAFETSGQAEPQYIYAYLKSVTNATDFQATNDSLQTSKACLINSTSASDDKIQGLTSNWSWYISLAQAGFALPVLMFVGPMADKIGRKPLILWNVLLVCISLALKTTIVYMNLHLYFYVIACGILGLSGNFYVFHLANIAILADCTSEGKERSFVLVIYETLLGLGTACSQVATAIGILRFLPISMIKAVLSRLVSKDKQGVLFSNVYLMEAVCSLGAATLFNNIYDQTMSIYNGLVFFVMAGVSTVAVLFLIYISCTNTQHIRDEIIIEKPTDNIENRDLTINSNEQKSTSM
ncbi:proton-coupled folate transporter-like [Mytilus californianus]|uniref:proton-coupled folate transporter-like n=1 Tax=Mytilus californianus TaxID=6549 RepID=UPI00224525B6|nr:proton-coupled folate transporter-like [Mytilus californianus]